MTTTDDKPAGYTFGRPTKYRPEMCEQVIEWGRKGKSRAWIAANLGVCKRTIQLWEMEYPDFLASLSLAKTLEQAHWEDIGHDCMVMAQGQTFSQSAWGRSMSARFGDDWREKVAHVGGNKDDDPIKQEVTFGADAFTRAIAGLTARGSAADADGTPDA